MTNSTKVEIRIMYSDFVFPCILLFFCYSGTFAQEVILTTLNLILTQIRFLIKIDPCYKYLNVDKNPMLVYDCNILCFLFIF